MKERQKEEAIKRMKKLKMSKNVIKDFIEKDIVYYSERQNKFFDGILYWVSNRKDFVKLIKEFEAATSGLVYHAQLTHIEFGEIFTLLFVSPYTDEWESDLQELASGQAFVYTTGIFGGEYGIADITPKNGGISRT